MKRWWPKAAVLLFALAPLAAAGDPLGGEVTATIGADGAAIARVTFRFPADMANLGAGEAPIAMRCPVAGAGRWTDPATYVWEYARPLPGGLVCRGELKPGLRTLAGVPVQGKRSFAIDSGGPTARAILPAAGDETEERQSFFVAANGPVDRASVAANAYCAVDGIGERIAVDLLPPDTAPRVLGAMGKDDWRPGNFLDEAGVPAAARRSPAALADIVALRCRRPLPPGRDVALVWSGQIRSPSGRIAGDDRRFDFTVRKEFVAKLECGRVNAHAGCDPVEPINVSFTAPVPRATALAARLDVGGGRLLVPSDEGHDATLDQVTFKPPLPPSITAKLVLPARFADESGRPLANAARFPLDVDIAEAPPLAKFAAPFGILEAREGGVLPVTIRAIEPALGKGVRAIAGGTARIEANDGTIADWVRRVAKAQENDFREEGPGKRKVSVNHTGDTPLLLGASGVRRSSLALPAGGKAFEVVGIPLAAPGFYVVELASPTLGRALLGRPATRYVSAAALVTNMAVHFKWGRTNALAWVTSLDSGAPVAGAAVSVSDSCSGRPLARGTTDRAGRLLVHGLPAPSGNDGCENTGDASPPLIVSARSGADYSFLLTSWGQGIAPYDFDLSYGYDAPQPIFHTIFDRTLLRAGETLHMKHVLRLPTASGFRSGGAARGTLTLQHRGSETSFALPVVLGRDGIGETEWTPPAGAPTGDYDLTVTLGAQDALQRPEHPRRRVPPAVHARERERPEGTGRAAEAAAGRSLCRLSLRRRRGPGAGAAAHRL